MDAGRSSSREAEGVTQHILAIDGVPVNSLNAGEAVRNLRGEVGTVVTLDIRRKGVVEPISLTVQRISLQ